MTKDQEYTAIKNEWLNKHPDATQEEIERFCKELAKKLKY